ncbi:hypothetical protein HWV62_10176 [Athelia sp. TMB]|nr:hypothetical protein HWV62_10176 [Athelia sp. TMB]
MSAPFKRARTQSSEAAASGLPRKVARLQNDSDDVDRAAGPSHLVQNINTGPTLNAIGTSGGTVMMVAGNVIQGDYHEHSTSTGNNTQPSSTSPYQYYESKIHEWMKAPDTSPSYNAARKKHQSGTGSWFLDGEQFRDWKKRPGSTIWLYGGPGCGKTILCSSAIDNVINHCKAEPSNRRYAYVFFDGTKAQSEALDYDKLIRSIITQLSDRCGDDMPTALVELYHACDDGRRQPLESQLESTLSRILETDGSTYIVVDSLDECVEKDDLLRWIQSMTSMTSGKLHVMLTSRPEPEIKRGLSCLSGCQKVDIIKQSVAIDIDTYIDAELAKMHKWNKPGEKVAIKDALVDGSDGMFRWVTLQIDDMKKCKSKADLLRQLKSLPKGLNGAYARIFERSESPKALTTLVHWLAYAESPMTVEQLAHVVAVNLDDDDGPSYHPDEVYEDAAEVFAVCYGLVTEIEGTVRLAHFSVKEYFIARVESKTHALLITSEQLSHSVIAQICLAQLLYCDGPSILDWEQSLSLRDINDKLPLVQYAAMNWISHFQYSGADYVPWSPLDKLLLRLFTLPATKWSYPLLSWVNIQNLVLSWDFVYRLQSHKSDTGQLSILRRILAPDIKHRYSALPIHASALYYACFSGSFRAVKHLVSNGVDFEEHSYLSSEPPTAPLLIASHEGHLEITKLLLDSGADVNLKDKRWFVSTALQAACYGGHLEVARLLLASGADVNMDEGQNCTALQISCYGGHPEVARLLLASGADVNVDEWEKGTALQIACEGDHLELARLLLASGADANAAGRTCITALETACIKGNFELARLLLASGANANAGRGLDVTVLQLACFKDHLELAGLLLARGADANLRAGEVKLPLSVACEKGHLELVRMLLASGANVDKEDGDYGTALRAACGKGHVEVARLLIDNGADVNLGWECEPEDDEGNWEGGFYGTALKLACRFGEFEIFKLLLASGADVNMDGGYYGTTLQEACRRGIPEAARLLLDSGAEVNAEGGYYCTALQAACRRGDLNVSELLLDRGAEVNIEGGYYGTALQAACEAGHLDVARLLLNNGAEVNIEGVYQGTALQLACKGGYLGLTRLLLASGADVDVALQATDDMKHIKYHLERLDSGFVNELEAREYGTTLQAACVGGNIEIVGLLLDSGADVSVQGGVFGTALQAACYCGYLEIARLLLDSGADVDVVGGRYGCALWGACYEGHLEVARLLLDNGADVHFKRPECFAALYKAYQAYGHLGIEQYGTAMQIACSMHHTEVAKLLRERGAVEIQEASGAL